jgi:hypothetical protein
VANEKLGRGFELGSRKTYSGQTLDWKTLESAFPKLWETWETLGFPKAWGGTFGFCVSPHNLPNEFPFYVSANQN